MFDVGLKMLSSFYLCGKIKGSRSPREEEIPVKLYTTNVCTYIREMLYGCAYVKYTICINLWVSRLVRRNYAYKSIGMQVFLVQLSFWLQQSVKKIAKY